MGLSGNTDWNPFQPPSTAQKLYISNPGDSQIIVPGTAFWNNWSVDGSHNDCGIGFWVSGTGGCDAGGGAAFYSASPNATAPYFGRGSTTFDFTTNADAVRATIKVQVSPYAAAGDDELGYFLLSDPNVLIPLFSHPAASGSQSVFAPAGVWGLYVRDSSANLLLRSTATDDSGRSYFAVFQLPGSNHYIVGMEDTTLATNSDFDFNDLVIELQDSPVQTPEPVSAVLVAAGLLALAAIRKTYPQNGSA